MPVDRHEGNAGFEQASGQQTALAEQMPPIRCAHAVRLAVELEGALHHGGTDQGVSALIVCVQVGEDAPRLHGPQLPIKEWQQRSPILQALGALYYQSGSLKEAKKLLYESVELARRGDYHDTLFGSYFYLWRMEGQKGRPGAATLERAMRNLLPKLDEKLEEAEAFRKLMEERKNAKP